MDSGGPNEPCVRWGVQIALYKGAILGGKDMLADLSRLTDGNALTSAGAVVALSLVGDESIHCCKG